ncbi:hypothetical protein SAY87_000163 [Trapa incisa]|uniref:Uncharacterized protein n=1 Tax=Trapa incisa TaxID=236973 RepID=A0AAN7JGE7_9MYRT|nr:hypothetical protein SAY87_000163 [Trapa incisa]
MWPVCLQAVKMVDSQCWFRIRPSALPMLPAAKARPAVLHLPAVWKPRTGYLTIRCSVCQPPPVPLIGGGVGEESVEILERFFRGPSSADTGPVMTGKHGAFGAVTLEKGKLNMPQKQSKSSPELAIGGGGGDIGKKIKHGGGGGGDDDGDDDNYFDDFDDGDEGDEVLRVMNINFSETARHAWLGSEADLLVHSGDLLKAYNRPSICSDPTPSKPSFKWSILKNTIISGFGLLGTRQGCTESTNGKGAAPAKTRRKRIVRKKMVAG